MLIRSTVVTRLRQSVRRAATKASTSWSAHLPTLTRPEATPAEEENENFESPAVPGDAEASHAARLHPSAFAFLRTNTIRVGQRGNQNPGRIVSLWQHVSSYARGCYDEKHVLVDEEAEAVIADVIESHSEREVGRTRLMDADGGVCGVTAALLRRGAFDQATVFVRDKKLRQLQDWALKHQLADVADRVQFAEVNLNKMISDFLNSRSAYLSPLYDQLEGFSDWNKPEPPYTLYGTATHSLIKYLTNRCIHRDSLLSEFFKGRPEFFLFVSGRTLLHLTSDMSSKMLYRPANILFQLVFDKDVLLRVSTT